MTNFTPEDLLLYLYKESSPELTQAIEKALKMDWTLREKLAIIQVAGERLEKILESPRTEVILNILDYARTTAAEEVQ